MKYCIKIDNIKNLCSLTVVLLPVLSMYKSPIGAIDLGTFLVIIVFGMTFVIGKNLEKNKQAIVRADIWVLYIAYTIIITVFSLMSSIHYANPSVYVLRLAKNIIFICFALFICRKGFFDFKPAFKYYSISVMAATFVICLQSVSYALFHYDLAGYFPKWIAVEGYMNRASNLATGQFRPTSVFFEPAHYFEYVSIAIVIFLLYSKDRLAMAKAVYITMGVILSTSGQGIVFTAFIWGVWILKSMKKMTTKRAVSLFAALILFIAAVFYFLYSQSGSQAIARLLSPGESFILSGRSDGYVQLKALTVLERIFGRGYGNYTSVFFSSWSFNLYCLGIIGTAIILLIYIYCWRYTDKKMIVLLNALMCVFSNVFMGFYFVFFFCFIFVKSDAGVVKNQTNGVLGAVYEK